MMKNVTVILLTLVFYCLSSALFSQSITLNNSSITVKEAIETLKEQSGYSFVYEVGDLDTKKQVAVSARDASVEDVVKQIIKGQDVSYRIVGKSIVITKGKMAVATPEENPRKIEGTIVDESGEPSIGATVSVKNSSIGTVTDIDGHFSLSVPADAVLTISYIGYENQEVAVKDRTDFRITLIEDNNILEEIVVIGYGTMKKKDLTGAVSSIKMSDQPVGTVSSISNLMAGKAAGLQVSLNSAQPGASSKFLIRGAASINASNDPLIIIDGAPISPMGDLNTSSLGEQNTYDNVLGSLNPNDVESIEVLKDASSTAIYGSRAANGVILVTTKRGKTGAPTVTYSGTATVQFFAKKYDMLNARDFMRQTNRYLYEQYLQDNKIGIYGGKDISDATRPFSPRYSDAEILFQTQDTDWFDETTRNGFQTQHNVSVNGGTEYTSYYISANYFKQDGLVKRNGIERYTGRANLDQKISKYVKMGITLNLSRNETKGDGGSLTSAASFNPLIPIKEEDGTWGVNPLTSYMANPVAMLDITQNSTKDRVLANSYIEVEPIDDLTLKVIGGFDRQAQKSGSYIPGSLGPNYNNGSANIAQGDRTNYLFDFTANWLKNIGDHNINALAGYSFERFTDEKVMAGNQNFLTDAFLYHYLWGGAAERPSVGSGASKREMASFFGRINYSFMDRYLLTATLRADGSSEFAKNHRWGYFPSVALGWRFTEEEFMKPLQNTLSNGKLRLTYGQTGNASSMNGAISYYRTGYEHVFGDKNAPGVYLNQLGNPDLKWETTTEWNVGLDLGFFNNRLNVTAEYYNRVISDLLSTRYLLSYHEVTSIQANIGKTQSQGFELTINTENVRTPNLSWTSDFTFSFYRDKWKERAPSWVPSIHEKYDAPIRALYVYASDGLVHLNDDVSHLPGAIPGQVKIRDIGSYIYNTDGSIQVDDHGKPLRSRDLDGMINDADKYLLGSSDPGYLLGFNNSFRYKNFDLNAYFYGQFHLWNSGSYKRTWLSGGANIDRGYNSPVSLQDTWSHDNMDAVYPTMLPSTSTFGAGDYFWKKIWFLRCRNITLGYTLPKQHVSKWASNLRIYAEVTNPFVLTSYDGLDPETDTNTVSYPNTRGISLGVNVSF